MNRLFNRKVKVQPVQVQPQSIEMASVAPLSTVIEGISLVQTRFYTVNLYCCNCNPSFYFDAAIPYGIKAAGCHVVCPNCGVLGAINHYHQTWPVNRMLQT